MKIRETSLIIVKTILSVVIWLSFLEVFTPRPIWASAKGNTTLSTSITVDNSTDVGPFANLVIVDGNPAIAYFDRFNLHLKYVRASDPGGTAWGSPVIADGTKYSGLYVSLAIVNGRPAIAYYNSSSKTLNYIRANDADGSAWGAPVTVDNSGKVGLYASLAVINGNPAIAYQDQTDVNQAILKFVRATDANGTAWGIPLVVDNSDNPGWGLSMKEVNGYPAIAYFNIGATASLRYALASNPNGTAWNSPISVDSPISGTIPSLTIVAGNPAIAYGDASSSANGHLEFVRAMDSTGTHWGIPVNVDITGNVGYFPWLAMVGGVPAIAYTDNTNHNLEYIQATNPTGSQWWQPVIVDSGQFDAYTSLAEVNGMPGIAYEDYSGTGTLRFIIPALPHYSKLFLPVVMR